MSANKKNKSVKLLFIIIIMAVIIGTGYIYLSPAFEQNKPIISSQKHIYWNLKSKINIKLKDESGIKYYKVTFKDGTKDIVLNQEVLTDVKKEISIEISPPKLDMFYKGINTALNIEVVDNSKWNLLEGNKATKNIDVTIDTKKPLANVVKNSRYIQRGGSAVVVVKVSDENLKEAYLSFNNKKRFKLTPYYKKDYFVALIAWPIDIETFNRVNLIAIDKANNKTITKIPLYIQKKNIKIDNVNLNDNFINNVSVSVLEQSFETVPKDPKDIFIYSNEILRAKNIEMIEKTIHKSMDNSLIENFNISYMKRLRGSKTVAGFAERRHYYLEEEKINEAWHLGIDFASVKNAAIRVSNKGKVVFNGYLGLYGNSIIVDHGMGLATLYAHTSTQSVEIGDIVKKNQKIAQTGSTGAVFGDHLHFGVLVQGVEVNPIEWMDRNWIKVRITDILKIAKKQIDGKL